MFASRNLHHIGRAVAGRDLHDAQAAATMVEPHGLGVDRHGGDLIARQIRQIAAMQADGHCRSGADRLFSGSASLFASLGIPITPVLSIIIACYKPSAYTL